jgi:hypothetical protein
MTIYAKTGTAQVAASQRGAPEERRADSLLISFVDDPRLPPLAVAFRVENGDATRDEKGLPRPTPAKHLAYRFYTSLLDHYGLWPELPPEPEPLPAQPEAPAPVGPLALNGSPEAAESPGTEPGLAPGSVAAAGSPPEGTPVLAAPGTDAVSGAAGASASPVPPVRRPPRAPSASEITRQLNLRNLEASHRGGSPGSAGTGEAAHRRGPASREAPPERGRTTTLY